MPRLTLPSTLAVVALGALSCTSSQSPAPSPDAAADVADATAPPADVCPDPFACSGELVFPDGSMNPVYLYLRDGAVSDVPCPGVPPQCPVA